MTIEGWMHRGGWMGTAGGEAPFADDLNGNARVLLDRAHERWHALLS